MPFIDGFIVERFLALFLNNATSFKFIYQRSLTWCTGKKNVFILHWPFMMPLSSSSVWNTLEPVSLRPPSHQEQHWALKPIWHRGASIIISIITSHDAHRTNTLFSLWACIVKGCKTLNTSQPPWNESESGVITFGKCKRAIPLYCFIGGPNWKWVGSTDRSLQYSRSVGTMRVYRAVWSSWKQRKKCGNHRPHFIWISDIWYMT